MKSIKLGNAITVAQSTDEPVLFGGYQDPSIRKGEDGALYVRFNARRDSWHTFGTEEKNPVYKSVDGGESWEQIQNGQHEWMRAGAKLPNGDIFYFREHTVLQKDTLPELPPLPNGAGQAYTIRGEYYLLGSDSPKKKEDDPNAKSDPAAAGQAQ